jgi:hypothetical protein
MGETIENMFYQFVEKLFFPGYFFFACSITFSISRSCLS